MKIYLVRHGQTDYNRKNLFQGITDNPLNNTGLEQAKELAEILKDKRFDVIFSSPLKRALMTAEIIREGNRYRPPIVIDDRLREIDMGEWEGKHAPTIKEEHKELFREIWKDPFKFNPPGGERFEEMVQRLREFLEDLKKKDYDSVLIVAHQIVNSALRTLIEGGDWKDFWDRRQKNGEVWVLDLKDEEVRT